MMLLADLYRLLAALLDWRSHLRFLEGRPRYDVAFVTNFERDGQKAFMGWRGRHRPVTQGLRFSLDGALGRYLLINTSATDMETAEGRAVAKEQVRAAIDEAASDGARIVLFAAGTKRLFDAQELWEMQALYPRIVFTIGDHGTAWALHQDVFGAIERGGLTKESEIMVIGPNGFLGSEVTKALTKAGYRNLHLVSSRNERPFDDLGNIEMVVACSHHRRVRLTAETLTRIAHENGIQVVDVCKPANLRKNELAKCSEKVHRQDAGNTSNQRLDYVFAAGAAKVLAHLKLSLDRLYGCFSEAMALTALTTAELRRHDFLHINDASYELIADLMPARGFHATPLCNFGVVEAHN